MSETSTHSVLLTVGHRFRGLIVTARLESLARSALDAEGLSACELGVVITDDATIRRLNRKYAGDDATTDVLSFSLREGEEFVTPDGMQRVGEVVISYPTAERQAREAGCATEDEIDHLLVHGILHLLGHDHAEPDDEKRMRAREEALLGIAHWHAL